MDHHARSSCDIAGAGGTWTSEVGIPTSERKLKLQLVDGV
jgi:hypothetical protein